MLASVPGSLVGISPSSSCATLLSLWGAGTGIWRGSVAAAGKVNALGVSDRNLWIGVWAYVRWMVCSRVEMVGSFAIFSGVDHALGVGWIDGLGGIVSGDSRLVG